MGLSASKRVDHTRGGNTDTRTHSFRARTTLVWSHFIPLSSLPSPPLSESRKLSDAIGLLWLLTAQKLCKFMSVGRGDDNTKSSRLSGIIWEHVPDTTKRHQFDWFVAKFSLFLIYNQIHWATKLALCMCAMGTKQLKAAKIASYDLLFAWA